MEELSCQLYLLAKELARDNNLEVNFVVGDYGQINIEEFNEVKVYKIIFTK